MQTPSFIDPKEMARLSARMLIEIGAVNFNTKAPYTLASGIVSPSYIDCRTIISYPRIRSALMDFMVAKVMANVGFEAFDVIAGGETAGIPFGAFVAERMGLPMAYVRKKPKGYGRNAQIEGVISEGDRVLLVEDLTTDGGSKLKFVKALKDAGAKCQHTSVVFFYDIFPDTEKNLAANDLSLHYLTTWPDVLAAAREGDYFDASTLDEVDNFFKDPLGWSASRGGVSEVSR